MNKRLSFLTFNKDEQGTSKGADTPGAPEMKAVVRSSNSQLLGCSTGPGAAINSLKQVRGLAMGNREDHDMRYNGLVNSSSSLRFLLHLGVAQCLLSFSFLFSKYVDPWLWLRPPPVYSRHTVWLKLLLASSRSHSSPLLWRVVVDASQAGCRAPSLRD